MSKCKTCNGRGRWQVREQLSGSEDSIYFEECNDCNGTGIQPDPEADSDFDIKGGDDD